MWDTFCKNMQKYNYWPHYFCPSKDLSFFKRFEIATGLIFMILYIQKISENYRFILILVNIIQK